MTTADRHPHSIRFDFDRENLRRYLRIKWALAWMLTLGGLGAFFSTIRIGDALERAGTLTADNAATCLRFLATGTGAGFLLGAVCYLGFSHFRAGRLAATLSLEVEGAFLRISQGGLFKSDRKLHFRSIIDYSVVEGPLRRRFGLRTLVMTIPGGPAGMISIGGLHDCDAVRDMLAEIDAAREQGPG